MPKFTVIENDRNIDYDDEIRRHRFKRNTIIILLVTLILIVVVGRLIYRSVKMFDDYSVLTSLDKESTKNSHCIKYKSGFLKYDNDGITYYDDRNHVVWQQSYELKNPQVKICGGYIGVVGKGESKVYVLNESGLKKTMDTALSITQIEMAKTGAFVVALEDGNINYIRMYDVRGNLVYDLKKILSGDGYPLDVAVSDDGTKLVISAVRLEEAEIKSELMFYNFSEVGKNEVDYFVGSVTSKEIVPEVEFATNDRVVAVSEKSLLTFDMEQYPKLAGKVNFGFKIKRLFVDRTNIGIVYETGKKEGKYCLLNYNHKGKKRAEYLYDEDFTDIVFMEKYVMLYNTDLARMIDMHGKKKFEYKFDIPLMDVVWIKDKDRFTFVNSKTIQQIRLK